MSHDIHATQALNLQMNTRIKLVDIIANGNKQVSIYTG